MQGRGNDGDSIYLLLPGITLTIIWQLHFLISPSHSFCWRYQPSFYIGVEDLDRRLHLADLKSRIMITHADRIY